MTSPSWQLGVLRRTFPNIDGIPGDSVLKAVGFSLPVLSH